MKRSDLNRLNHAYHRADVAADAESIERIREERPTVLLAKITDYVSVGTNRWVYDWKLADILPSTVGTGYSFAMTPSETFYLGKALNVCEAMNTAGFVGPGVNPVNIPAGFSVKPVQGYVLIYPQNRTISESVGGEEMWVFYAPNAIDGTCETPLVGDTDYGYFFFPTDLDDEYGTFDAPEGDTDFGTINLSDFGTFANPSNDGDYQTFASPYANTVDYGDII